MPYGPYISVTVTDKTRAGDDPTSHLVAGRNFPDRQDAERYMAVWEQHAPHLTVRLAWDCRSNYEPDYTGWHCDDLGVIHEGQPAAITALLEPCPAPTQQDRTPRQTTPTPTRPPTDTPAATESAPVDAEPVPAEPKPLFAHHPHFRAARDLGYRIEYTFDPFTGQEPEPDVPAYTGDRTDDDRWRQWEARRDEFAAAHQAWATARLRAVMAPLLTDAAAAYPAVRDALERIDQAWEDLKRPPYGWEPAVMTLLEAHKHALTVVETWEDQHAKHLATTGRDLVDYPHGEQAKASLARELGITDFGTWPIGDADDYEQAASMWGYSTRPTATLRRKIDEQRRELSEIVAIAGGARS